MSKNKMKKPFLKTVSVTLASLLAFSSLSPLSYALPEITYPDGMDCVLVSDDNAIFNVENAVVKGNIYAHDNIDFYGSKSMKVDGFADSKGNVDSNIEADKSENTSGYKVPDFSSAIEKNAKYGQVFDSDSEISNTELDVTEGISVNGKLKLDEVTLLGGGYITANGTIKCNLIQSKDTTDNYAVIYSKDGDIIISGSNLTINGIIYAPNGKVIFNVKNLTVNGGVYAENVEFNGTTLNLNKTENYNFLVTEKLTVDAGEDREIYVGDTLDFEGTSNYDGVSYKWTADESISFDNPDSQNTTATFSKAGTYKITLTGTVGDMKAENSFNVKVNPDPSKVFTTDKDFETGKTDGITADNNTLTLEKEQKTSNEIKKSYVSEGVSGINVDSTVTKDKITSKSDELSINYNLTGTGSIETEKQGVDFVFLIDNSGSMYGEYLENAQQAAKTIMTYMNEGDRYAISDLGRLHIGFTDDTEVLNQEIDRVKYGSGSSEMDDGIVIANQLFDEQSSEDRQKYILLLTDGEDCWNYSIERMREVAQESADRNIKIFALAMRSEMQDMQEVAITTKGIYKHCPDAEAIKKFMEQFGAEIFNAAAKNVLFKTTVADINKIDLENISPAPAAVNKNDDGSAEISWSFNTFEIDEVNNISIPVKYDMFKESGYESLTYNTALYYNDKEGKGHKTYIDDVTLPCDTHKDSGTWEGIYDSKRENCNWTGIYWNALYPSDSSANVYVAVSNDGVNFTENKKIENYTVPENLSGRYIRITVEMQKASDGSVPVFDDITVISGTMKLSEPAEQSASVKVSGNANLYANKPATFYANIMSKSDSIEKTEWTVSGTENYTLDTSNPLAAKITFADEGEYSVTLKVYTDDEKYTENTFNVVVDKEESVADIIFDDGSSSKPVKYTIESDLKPLPNKNYNNYNYNTNIDHNIKLITDNPSAISWVSVHFIADDGSVQNGYNKVWVYSIDEEFNSTFKVPYGKSGTVEITAYDWNGNAYTDKFTVTYDRIAPTVTLTKPESEHDNKRFYTEDSYTIKVEASDDNELDTIKLYVNETEVSLDENNQYTFTLTQNGYYNFRAEAIDTAGNIGKALNNIYVYKDTNPPYIILNLNRYNAFIGNEIVLKANVYDNETGLKSVNYYINDEEIELDENSEYKYIASEVGEFVFKAVATDNRDNTSERILNLKVMEDTSAPSVSISTTNPGSMVVGTSTVVTVKADDNVGVTKIEVDVNGTPYELDENNQFVLKAETEGQLLINATAYDNAGNNRKATYRLNVIPEDTTPPTVNINVSSRYEYNNNSCRIYIYSSDNTQIASREFYLDGKKVDTESSYALPEYRYDDYYTFVPMEIGIGEHTVKAITTDGSGNKTEQEKTFTVSDTTAPSVYISGSTVYNTGATVTVNVSVTDNSKIKSVTGTMNETALSLTTDSEQTITIENAKAGTYLFTITAQDIYGNERTNTRTVTVRDTEKPVITLSDVEEEYFIPSVPVIRMTVTDNVEVSSITVKMGDEELEYDGDKIVLPESLPEGDYTIVITAKDSSNNTDTKTVKFRISKPRDVTPPEITSLMITPEKIDIGTKIKVYVTATDNSGKTITEVSTSDGELFTYEDSAYVYTPEKAGEITIIIKVSDEAGNYVTQTATNTVYADITPPTVDVDALLSMNVNEKQTISITAKDNSSILKTGLQLNGSEVDLSGNSYEFNPTSSGDYSFTAYAVDSSGNIGKKEFVVNVKEKETEEELSKYLINKDETAITDEIKKKADELGTATAVYDFIKNNVDTQFYSKSRKGATATYEQLRGNDIDTASLTVAMLRYLNYPSRYVSGTVQYSEDEIMALTGAKTLSAAQNTLASTDYDYKLYKKPDGSRIMQIEHTWVETYVPLSECGIDSEEKSWIALDPSYKKYKYITQEFEKIENKYLFDTAKSLSKNLSELPGYDINVDTADLKASMDAVVNDVDKDFIINEKVIKQEKVTALPKTADFNIITRNTSYEALSDTQSDMITFSIGYDYSSGYFDDFDDTEIASLKSSDIVGKRVLLQYLPATEKDQQLLDSYNGNLKGMNVNNLYVKPSVTVDGKVVGQGNAITLGQKQQFITNIKCSGRTKEYSDSVISGSMYAIVANVDNISANDLEKVKNYMQSNALSKTEYTPYSEEYLGALLDYAGKMYYSIHDLYEYYLSSMYNINFVPDISVGVFGYEFNTKENWVGQVTGNLQDGSFFTDIDAYTFKAISNCENDSERTAFILNNGVIGSYLESYIWEFITGKVSLSSMAAISIASGQGIELLYINQDNRSMTLPKLNVSSEVYNDVVSHVNRGYTVIIPAKEFTINQWSGTGYMMLDLENTDTENVFRISGGLNGGSSSETENLNRKIALESELKDDSLLTDEIVTQACITRIMIAQINVMLGATSMVQGAMTMAA
ncbi:MAG: Ig-like domain-containing protein, partial [Acutalibacteraceae bacterium]